jgi:hypothetical protein
MAGIADGQAQASRSDINPSYLLTGDPGAQGGGTLHSSDTDNLLRNYENVFGPAARDIKLDTQRHKRHQRWHLPDALKGVNSFLTDRVDGLITDATSSPFTKNILPYMYMENPDKKIKWNVYNFDEGMASRVPYEAAARVLPQSKRSFAGYVVRQGLAIAMEHNFMMSANGMDNFRKQLMQLVGSIQMTNDLDVHVALLHAPSYQRTQDEKYYDNTRSLFQNARMYVDLFGFVQKNENALDFLIEDAKNHLKTWGSQNPTFMLCNGALTKQLTMNPEKTNYITAGPDGKRKLAQGPDLPSYRGLSFINTRKFSTESGTAPRDMLRRRVRVAEHYRIPWNTSNLRARYEFYDQSRDTMFQHSWKALQQAAYPSDAESVNHVLQKLPTFRTSVEAAPHDYFTTAIVNGDDVPNTCEGLTKLQMGKLLQWFGIGVHGPQAAGANGDVPLYLPNKHTMRIYFEAVHRTIAVLTFSWDFIANHDPARVSEVKRVLFRIAAWRLKKLPQDQQSAYALLEFFVDTTQAAPVVRQAVAGAGGMGAPAIAFNDWITLETHHPLNQIQSLNHDDVLFPADLFILRPNIEHYMLGVIMGRGGGPEELGATFWGQTELSCYDDAQHGIWGMSYKYHERAIVTNEKNLIRVFDVCFDGYCGGNDAAILQWNNNSISEFKQRTTNLNAPYQGPSMVVMALPAHTNSFDAYPNPLNFHDRTFETDRLHPDRGLRASHADIAKHSPFVQPPNPGVPRANLWMNIAVHVAYATYYDLIGLQQWQSPNSGQAPGALASSNESEIFQLSFHGQMNIIDGITREDIMGSGHLGPSYVGVASIREGRGQMVRGPPKPVHIM